MEFVKGNQKNYIPDDFIQATTPLAILGESHFILKVIFIYI